MSASSKKQVWATPAKAQGYIGGMGDYAQARDQAVVQSMLGQGPGELLDFPCGTGRFIPLAMERGFSVTAADCSEAMLQLARRHEGPRFVEADAFRPPFAKDSFDVILMVRLLFHYARPQDILTAILPSLRPGGRMIFDTLNTFSTRWSASQFLQLSRRDPAKRLYFRTPSKMAQVLAGLGLEVLERRCLYILPTRAYRFLPRPLRPFLEALEKLAPPSLRVLSFWQVRKSATRTQESS